METLNFDCENLLTVLRFAECVRTLHGLEPSADTFRTASEYAGKGATARDLFKAYELCLQDESSFRKVLEEADFSPAQLTSPEIN